MKKFLAIFLSVLVVLTFAFFAIASSDSVDDGQGDDAAVVDENANIVVPDFSTMSNDEIKQWATDNNVVCEFSGEYSDSVPSGSFLRQSKEANSKVAEGTTIRIILSKGKEPSIEYQNALKQAETYSEMMHMSKQGIYDQLTSEYGGQFPADAAQYAIDNLVVDYKENALEQAKSYQETMGMSKNAIYDQLVSPYGGQFTPEEAQYAIDNLG